MPAANGHAKVSSKGDARVIVVMPAWNAARTLERTVSAIPRDWVDEIILVDDKSTDDTVEVARTLPRGPAGKLLHRAALAPGVVLFLGLIGLAGFTAFVPLYVRELDLGGADTLFLLYGGLILCVRIVGARLPDILGGRRAATIALTCGAVGLAVMAAWPSVAGLVVGTAVFAAGMSLLYPALLVLALTAVPDNERGSVVGTFSSFFDLSQGLGALILGGVAALSGYRGAFAGGAIAAGVGVVLLTTGVGLRAQTSAARERARSEAVPA